MRRCLRGERPLLGRGVPVRAAATGRGCVRGSLVSRQHGGYLSTRLRITPIITKLGSV